MRRLLVIPFALFILVVGVFFATPAKAAATYTNAAGPGPAALTWAVTHEMGCWYSWGGESCSPGYDCSGAVQTAFAHVGVRLPRTTYEMLASPMLVRVSSPQRGDLAFYGSGHVEIVTRWAHVTFGALDWGTRVGRHLWSSWWHPTEFFRVR